MGLGFFYGAFFMWIIFNYMTGPLTERLSPRNIKKSLLIIKDECLMIPWFPKSPVLYSYLAASAAACSLRRCLLPFLAPDLFFFTLSPRY